MTLFNVIKKKFNMAPHPSPDAFITKFCKNFHTKNMRAGLIYTLVFVKNNQDILLGYKKRGFGKDKWNGFGGKVEKNENIFDGAIRETKEECNLKLNSLNHIGIVAYEEQYCSKIDIVHIFTSSNYINQVEESEEMSPKWFNVKTIPYSKMWPDSKYWYPLMLKEKYFFAHVIYEDESTFKDVDIKEFNSLNFVLEAMKTIFPNIITD